MKNFTHNCCHYYTILCLIYTSTNIEIGIVKGEEKNREEARIKVENANADILLIAGCEDHIWNTYDGCMTIINSLESKNYPNFYSLLAYKNAGHPFPYPYTIPLCETSDKKIMPRIMFSTGGTFKGNSMAQIDSWEKTIDFFKGKINEVSKNTVNLI